MAWCERDENRVDYLFGLPRNQRLTRIIGAPIQQARMLYQSTGKPTPYLRRVLAPNQKELVMRPRVVAKAEYYCRSFARPSA